MRGILLAYLMLVVPVGAADCDTWVVKTLPNSSPGGGSSWFESIVFSFNDNRLTLNTTSLRTTVYNLNPTVYTCTVITSGEWAVCGTVANGALVRDPYATFVPQTTGGYVRWATDTPKGYQTQLLLGSAFEGDAATTYNWSLYDPGTGYRESGSVTAPLIADYRTEGFWAWQMSADVAPISHVFTAYAPLPEPSSLLVLLCGVSGFVKMILRRRSS